MAARRRRSERTEQITLVTRVRHFHPDVIIFAVPNGGNRNPREAANLKAEGVLPGVPDLVVAEPRDIYHGCYIEMKKVGEQAKKHQRELMDRLEDRGYYIILANLGVDRVWAEVEWYLALPISDWRSQPSEALAGCSHLLS